jgi:hypothetical protein
MRSLPLLRLHLPFILIAVFVLLFSRLSDSFRPTMTKFRGKAMLLHARNDSLAPVKLISSSNFSSLRAERKNNLNRRPIILDVYVGVVDGITDEVSKSVVHSDPMTSLHDPMSDPSHIARMIISNALSRMVQATSNHLATKELSDPGINLDHEADRHEKVKAAAKLVSSLLLRIIVFPAIFHSIAYAIPELTVQEIIEWLKHFVEMNQ